MIFKLEEMAEFQKGFAFKSRDFKASGIKIVKVSNLTDESIDGSGCVHIDNELADNYKQYELNSDDIIITTVGSWPTNPASVVGKVVRVPKQMKGSLLNQNAVRVRSHQSVDQKYLFYLMKSNFFKDYIIGTAQGSANQASITQKDIKNFKYDIHEFEEQKAIAHILSTLDKKIETNNKINKKLEEMAQVIFKQWFVDFEFPCLPKNYKFSGADKADDYDKVLTYKRVGGLPIPDGKSWFVYVLLCDDGSFYKGMTNDLYRRFYEHYTGIGAEWTKTHKPVKVIHYEKFNSQQEARKREEELKSGYGREWIKREYKKYQEGLPAHQTRLMMAGEMIESELGMIPKGWRQSTFGEVAILSAGGDKPKSFSKNVTKEHIVPIYSNGIDNEGLYGYTDKAKIFEEAITVSARGTIGYVCLRQQPYFPIVRLVSLVPHTDIITSKYLYFYLKLINISGTGTTQQQLTVPDFKRTKICVPEYKVTKQFTDIVNDVFKKIEIGKSENVKLSEMRDILLPKLMSGEIRVPIDSDEE